MDPPPTAQPCRITTYLKYSMLKKPRRAKRGRQNQRQISQLVRAPEPTPDQPVGRGQVVGRPAAPHFHYRHAVTFFSEPMGRDAAAEAGADHDEIEVAPRIGHNGLFI